MKLKPTTRPGNPPRKFPPLVASANIQLKSILACTDFSDVLNEHNCQGWLQGYLLTGRHGLFPCYEAFISIVDGMMNQYAKFIKASGEVP